ncbi:histidinol-phosphate transaminase [Verrucomicrobiota bacterium]
MTNFPQTANSWVGGLATYEPGRPIEEVARELGFESAGEIIKLASNENALGPSPMAVEAIRKHAAEMHRYPDGGAYYLKRKLAERLDVKPEQLLPANGSNEIIELMAHVFLGPDNGIVVADQAFVVYRLIAECFQAEIVSVPMKRFTHDLSAMLEAIKPNSRIVFISNPNNPTSTMVGEQEINDFMSKVSDDIIVCFDEAYIELLPPAQQPDTLKFVKEGRNVVILRTFSKTYGLAGLRIGYAVAAEPCISLLNKVRQPFNVNSMAMTAAIAALDDDSHVGKTREMVQAGLAYLQGEFEGMGLNFVPAVANFLLVEVGSGPSDPLRTGRKVFETLQKEGIIVRPMDVYGLPGFIRVTVGTEEENTRFIKAFKALI